MFHHHGHLHTLTVKTGDVVNVGSLLGTVGKSGLSAGAGAHDHYEVSIDKPPTWTYYPQGKSKAWVQAHYVDPTKYIDEAQNLPCKWTNKTAGNQWLDYYKPHNVYHPGRDLNSGYGDQDLGNEVRSTVAGRVVYAGTDDGWGRHVWIEELELKTTYMKVTCVANNNNWTTLQTQLATLGEWFKTYSGGKLEIVFDIKNTAYQNIPFQDWGTFISVNVDWYRKNVTPYATGQLTLFLVNPSDWKAPTQGTMTYADPEKPVRTEVMAIEDERDVFIQRAFHEICHAMFFLTGQPDRVHELLYQNPPKHQELLALVDYQKLQAKLVTIKPEPMNQTKVVLGKDGKTVYEAKPIAISFEEYKKQAGVEGIVIPSPIPPASSL